MKLIDFLMPHLFGASSSKRLIQAGEVRVNDVIITDPNFQLTPLDIVRVGRRMALIFKEEDNWRKNDS